MPRNDTNTQGKSRKAQAKKKSDRSSEENAKQPVRRSAKASDRQSGESARWTFFSNHAHVLICLYEDSEMVLRELAIRVGITERSVQSIIQDLEDAGYIERERVGRRNRYHVIHNKHLRHPIEEHCTVDMLVEVILKNV